MASETSQTTEADLKYELKSFKTKYESISGLELPYEYLRNSKVYIFKRNQEIIGGYILGKSTPLRTVDLFISSDNQMSLNSLFSKEKYCEVCCFWISRKFRKSPYLNAKFWLSMANEVRKQEKEIIVYGTNSKGLAKLYDYPQVSTLFHKDKIQNKN